MILKIMQVILYPFGWLYGQCWYYYLVWFKRMGKDEALDHMEEKWNRLESGDFRK